ncbi:MAG: DUF1127 domain-containing protein [Tabrizicola sp.]
MWKRIKRWWDAEGAMMELQGVSDRMLADMGLDRETLRAQVQGRFDPVPEPLDCYRHPLRSAAMTR